MKRLEMTAGMADEGCGSGSAVKTCARRFALSAKGVCSYYLACDLDEGLLRYWSKDPDPYRRLAYSPSIEERKIAEGLAGMSGESGRAVGVRLTRRQRRDIEEILSWENIESMRGIDDAFMLERCGGGWCYRDGWSLSCYFEGDSGWPPLELEDIFHCSFSGEELPFERLETYISSEILCNSTAKHSFDSSPKVKPGTAKKLVLQAVESGLEAIEEILWSGNVRLIKELDKAVLDRDLSYELTDDCFTVSYGNAVLRTYELYERSACEKVFGRAHTFGQTVDGEAGGGE